MFEKIRANIQNANEIRAEKAKFLCEHFVPLCECALTMISANGGKGKSFLALQIALQLALKEKKKSLLWLSEDSKSTSKHRMEELLKHTIKTSAKILSFIDICDEIPPALNELNIKYYAEIFKPYDLIIMDPLIAFYNNDENNNAQARVFMNGLNFIARENHQSILITYHSTKQNANEASKSRGASAFVDAVRLAYELDFTSDFKNKEERLLKITKDNLGLRVKKEWESGHKIINVLPIKKAKIKHKIIDENDNFINIISDDESDLEKWENAKKKAGNGINLF